VIECADESCCSPPRKALQSMFADTFMPPPCSILQTSSKLIVPSLLDKGTSKFSPFLVRLSADLSSPLEGLKQMPYDMFSPSVQSGLKKKYVQPVGSISHLRRVFKCTVVACMARLSKTIVKLEYGHSTLLPKGKRASLHCA
ncbi:hypothetical protein HHI36_019963, partial [Cryptolaemus montrouzieri]